MGVLTGLLLLGLLACDGAVLQQWARPQQQHQALSPSQRPLLQRQPKLSDSEVPFEKCQVEEGEKIRCGSSDITAEQCETINCCFDGQQCYYGKAVTVQCTRDGQFVVVVARDATLPHIDVEAITLLQTNDDSCNPAGTTAAFAIFQFPVTACGTTMMEEDNYVVYENHMSSSYEVGIGPRGSITRDSHFELLFQCKYSESAVEALVIDVNTLPPPQSVAAPGPLRMELQLANGQCASKGCYEEEAAYRSYYTPADYPIRKTLRDNLYVEVHILERSDPNIHLTLEHCWATATSAPEGRPQWDLLKNGCPYQDDRYLTTIVPVAGASELQFPTHYKRFIVKMFTFVDKETFVPLKETVFIHCAAAACYEDGAGSCEQSCHRQRRAVAVKASSGQKVLVSSGEVILTADQSLKSTEGVKPSLPKLQL